MLNRPHLHTSATTPVHSGNTQWPNYWATRLAIPCLTAVCQAANSLCPAGHCAGMYRKCSCRSHKLGIPVRGAVQLSDVGGPGLLVQAVHVLGDQRIHPAPLLQPRQPLMRGVGVDVAELVPACAVQDFKHCMCNG